MGSVSEKPEEKGRKRRRVDGRRGEKERIGHVR